MKIFAFGDSFVAGDQDDFLEENPGVTTHAMRMNERVEYLKYNVSCMALLAQRLGYEFENHAERGSSNFAQLDQLTMILFNQQIAPGDVVFFGLTTTYRDRAAIFNKVQNRSYIALVDYNLLWNFELTELTKIDQLYVLGVLEHLAKMFDVTIVKFMAFDNSMFDINVDQHKFTNYIEDTMIDILNNSTGKVINNYPFGSVVAPEVQHLYTHMRHPSVEGHVKLADWYEAWVRKNLTIDKTV